MLIDGTGREKGRSGRYLDKIAVRSDIEARLQQLYENTSANYFDVYSRSGRIFALKFKPPKQQPWLVRLDSAMDLKSERVVLDPNELNSNVATTIDWYV